MDPNLLAVFSGHRHVAKEFTEDGVRYYLAGALCPAPDENGNVRIERLFQPKYPYEFLSKRGNEEYIKAKRDDEAYIREIYKK